MSNTPCKECNDRTIGCHAICGRYLYYAARRKLEKHRRYLELLPDYYAGCRASKMNAQKSLADKRMRTK